jgi:sulfonate transport system substrate-binding protein
MHNKFSLRRRLVAQLAGAFALTGLLTACGGAGGSTAATEPETIRLDYAYYNPLSLVLKQQGWLEKDLAKQHIKVEWVLSQGSNKALEFLNGKSIDFGSTAGAAALIGQWQPVEGHLHLLEARVDGLGHQCQLDHQVGG